MASSGFDCTGSGAPLLIGVTTYLEQAQTGVWDLRAAFLPKAYIDAVTDSGAVAVLLAPQPVSARIAHALLAPLAGLIVSGGADVDPARYGQRAHARTGAPRAERDEWEAQLIAAAIALDLPLLCICRGMQLLNVALGGSLIQHLPDRLGGSNAYQPGAGKFGSARVAVQAQSRLGALLGGAAKAPAAAAAEAVELSVAVYHHQAVDAVAPGLQVSARSADGVIEALEHERMRFGLAVQWHPEETAADRRIFQGLSAAARAYRAARCAPPPDPRSADPEPGQRAERTGDAT